MPYMQTSGLTGITPTRPGLAGITPTSSGLVGLGCGVTPCDCGMGSLLDPSTWGPSDWLVAAGLAFTAFKLLGKTQERRFTRRVIKRLEDAR